MKSLWAAMVLTVCLLVPWGVTSRAASPLEELRVQSEVTVSDNRVSLLDICDPAKLPNDWKSVMARTDLGEAPAAGAAKFIDPEQLRAYLLKFIDSQGYPSSMVSLTLPERITISRQSNQINQEQVEAIFRKFVTDNSPWNPDDVVIQKIAFTGLTALPAGNLTHKVSSTIPRERFA
ncbi:MAG: hypothetical protein ACLGPL_05730, partial [Acidobacteriota bacterium]